MQSLSRRNAIQGVAATALASTVLQPARQVRAAAPEPQKITTELIAAARKEGKVSFYTSVELPVAERVAKAFQAKFPGISVRVERSGAERNFQRIAQEYASKIYACDITQSSDAAHFISWKRDGLLESYLPEEVASHYPPQHKDADGMFASWRIYLSVIAYNTKLVGAQEAPRSSGTIMTATQQMVRRSAGATSRSWRSRGSCNCNQLPIRQRRSQRASVRSRSTAPTTPSCNFRKRVSPSRLYTRARPPRSSAGQPPS